MKLHKLSVLFLLLTVIIFYPTRGFTQNSEDITRLQEQIFELESRIRELEDYTDSINSNLVDFSNKIQSNLKTYKDDINSSLDGYAKDLHSNIEMRMREFDEEIVVLNFASRGYRKMETNSGIFLISINKVERIEGGYRLILHVGNPNFASYQGLKLKLRWGKEWDSGRKASYTDWRQTLAGAEYAYRGNLAQGTWTEIAVDIAPVTTNELQYIEVSMDVGAIHLNLKKPRS